jgi:hypothetical protein
MRKTVENGFSKGKIKVKENREFYLHTRDGIFYAELLTADGVKLNARSTGTRDSF